MQISLKIFFAFLLLLTTCCFLSTNSIAQGYHKVYGSNAIEDDVAGTKTTAGGYLIAARSYGFGGPSGDVLLINADNIGNISWANRYTTAGIDDPGAVIQTSDGGAAIAGGSLGFPPNAVEGFLIKTSSAGTLQWTAVFGTPLDDNIFSVYQNPNNNYTLAGITESGSGPWDCYIVRINSSGLVLWQEAIGGPNTDICNAVQRTSGNGYIFAGETDSYGAGGDDVFLFKTDNSGTLLWAKAFGGAGNESAMAVKETSDGGFIMAGKTSSYGAGGDDVYLIKTNSSGTSQWKKTFGGAGNDKAYSIDITSDGGFILAGETSSFGAGGSDVYLIKTDSMGNLLWSRTSGQANTDYGSMVQQTTDGGFVVFGIDSGYGPNNTNIYLLKTDSLGLASCVQSPNTQVSSGGANATISPTVTNIGMVQSGSFSQNNVTTSPYNCFCVLTTLITPSGSTTFCQGGNVTLTSSSASSYSWSTGATSQSINVVSSGNYSVTTTDANGCTGSAGINITVNPTPGVSASSTPTGCAVPNGTATANISGGTPPFTYSWNNGQTTSIATGLGQGNYTITITDSQGCSIANTVSVAVIANTPIVSATSTPAGCTVANGTATANPSGGTPGYTYSWNPSGQTTQTATALASGTYTVTLTDANGCTAQTSVTLNSTSSPTVAVSSTQTDCTVANGTAASNPSGGTPGYTYLWNPSGQTTQTATGLASGTYTVTVTDTNGCTQTQTVSISQISGPIATAIATTVNITLGDNTQLTATGGGTYSWSPTTGLSCTTCSGPTATPSATTDYCVFVMDSNGCTDSACVIITVDIPCGEIYIPSAFSPNADGRNDLECARGDCIETLYFAIYDRWGEKVFETTNPKTCWDGTYRGNIMNTAVFTYYLEATLLSGEKITKKGNVSLIR